jgi:hypothetical protein
MEKKPLTDLTSKKAPASLLTWTAKEQTAFDTLKDSLCQTVELYVPQIGKLFILRTDASGVAIGACLSQKVDDNASVDEKGTGEHPIAFCSQKTPTQCNLQFEYS